MGIQVWSSKDRRRMRRWRCGMRHIGRCRWNCMNRTLIPHATPKSSAPLGVPMVCSALGAVSMPPPGAADGLPARLARALLAAISMAAIASPADRERLLATATYPVPQLHPNPRARTGQAAPTAAVSWLRPRRLHPSEVVRPLSGPPRLYLPTQDALHQAGPPVFHWPSTAIHKLLSPPRPPP